MMAQTATRLAFLVAGFGVSCWAPLVPLAKARLRLDDQALGLLLLCLGLGSICAMVCMGKVSARWGSKPFIVAGGLGLSVILPLLTLAQSPLTLGTSLFVFGVFLGTLDVTMNVHAIEVERLAKQPLMSGFHALFSAGGLAGAGAMTALLSGGISPPMATVLCAALMLMATLLAAPRLLRHTATESTATALLVKPHGLVVVLAGLAAITFLAEGAMLDWGALLLTTMGVASAHNAGLGFVVFSLAMTAGRFAGDTLTTRLGDRAMLLWGGGLAVAGFAVLLTATALVAALLGFGLIGLGAANLVPVLFRQAGLQKDMPLGQAISAITTTGYAGILIGPAAMGFVANNVGLPVTFWLLAGLLALVPLAAYRNITR